MQKHLRFLLSLVYSTLILAALLLLLPGLLPFLLAWSLACLLEPLVRFLSNHTFLHRPWAAAIVLLAFVLVLLVGCTALLRRLWYELGLLSSQIPEFFSAVQSLISRAEGLLYRLTVAAPTSLRPALETALETTGAQLTELISDLSARMLGQVANLFIGLPTAGLFIFTALLATFFILAGRPRLSAFFRRQIPERWLPRLETTTAKLKTALGDWLRAQAILMGVTFFLLGGGFLWMKAEPAILLAALVALLDALPVFGTGTILFPWAAIELLGGNLRRCTALLALYAVVWVARSLLEPKLVAARAGLHPLAALFSIYLGFTLFGVAGMILAPLAAVVLCQLHDGGVITLWKK